MRPSFKSLAWHVASPLPARILVVTPRPDDPARTAGPADEAEEAQTLQQPTLPWCFDAQLW